MADDLDSASLRVADLEKQLGVLGAIIESMTEGVIAVNKDTQIFLVNPSIEKIFGISRKDAQGKFFLEVIRNNDLAGVIGEVLTSGQFVSKELNLVLPVQKTFQVNASPILDHGDRVNGCSIVIHDITELRKLETIRRDFVANVSHELKTPLTSIKGFVETLLEGGLEDKDNSRHFLKIIQDHSDRLDNLIDDLLNLSSIESREVTLKVEDVNLKVLADKVLVGFKAQLRKKSLEVDNGLASDLSLSIDCGKIEQVLINLVDNAIKFNKEKGFVRIYSQDTTSGRVKIFVEDSGIGIPEKDLPRIFERFFRVDRARSRELGGTGLGLSIVKHIIELHGGVIGVESIEGQGSKFWFTLSR